MDETWTFVGRRDAATACRLRLALPTRYRHHCWYFTYLFPAYAQALLVWRKPEHGFDCRGT